MIGLSRIKIQDPGAQYRSTYRSRMVSAVHAVPLQDLCDILSYGPRSCRELLAARCWPGYCLLQRLCADINRAYTRALAKIEIDCIDAFRSLMI